MNSKLATLVLAILAISACSSTPTKPTTAEAPSQESATDNKQVITISEPAAPSATDITTAQLQEMKNKSIYFDVDQFAIKPEYLDLIQQRAEFLKAHANVVITLEGNADERGSSEYNLALGDKRANAVLKSLEVMGIRDTQIKAVSLGEEHPRLACHEEQCWKENRRVDFVGKQGS